MRRPALVSLLALVLLAVTPAGNQCLSFADLIANQSGNYTWKSSAPASSNRLVTQTDVSTYVNGCTATGSRIMTWSDVLGCASGHTPTQQNVAASGNWHDTYYTARFLNPTYICKTVASTGPYVVTLPSGANAPTAATSELTLSLSSISYTYDGAQSTTLDAQLYNPSGALVQTFTSTTATLTATYYNPSAPAGAWKWQISSTGAGGQSCDGTNGVTGNFDGASWSGTAYYYQ